MLTSENDLGQNPKLHSNIKYWLTAFIDASNSRSKFCLQLINTIIEWFARIMGNIFQTKKNLKYFQAAQLVEPPVVAIHPSLS